MFYKNTNLYKCRSKSFLSLSHVSIFSYALFIASARILKKFSEVPWASCWRQADKK